ncbi:MAG: hypothetical protein ACOCYE_13865 [Pseudomonadota bacterium]
MRAAIIGVVVVLALLGASLPARAIDAFFGTFVGAAELIDVVTGEKQQRDVVTVIQRHGEAGFRIDWQTVVRTGGRRDVPGVRFLVRSAAFEPVRGGGYYVQAADYDPFTVRETLEPMAGDALAWATVDGPDLHLYVFAISEAGGAELQHHRRRLTDDGMTLVYQGIIDGRVTTRATGQLVRVD